MSLAIERLLTRCHVPRRLNVNAAQVDRIVRDCFQQECARRLAPGRPDAGIFRIRRLSVRLTVRLADLNDRRLPALWAAAFFRAMGEALARPAGAGPVEVVRAGSRAAWLAQVLADVLAGNASSRWQYAEFQTFWALSCAEAALAILVNEPEAIPDTLALLEDRGLLVRILDLFDAVALERLARALGKTDEAGPGLEDLCAVADTISTLRAPIGRTVVSHQRLALRLYVLFRGKEKGMGGAAHSLRQVQQAVAVLAALLEILPAIGSLEALLDLEERAIARLLQTPLPPGIASLRSVLRAAGEDRSARSRAVTRLLEAVEKVRAHAPAAAEVSWISSDCAGLFLLTGVLEALDWPSRIRHGPVAAAQGPRALPCFLTGLGLAVLDRFSEAPSRLDPGLALFAGFVGEPDYAALRRFSAEAATPDLLALLEPPEAKAAAADAVPRDVPRVFAMLAERLVRDFAARVRGFRQASRAFLVARLFALPGRIWLEPKRLRIVLSPSPLHPALHASGMDAHVPAVSWLGGRDVEFELEGL